MKQTKRMTYYKDFKQVLFRTPLLPYNYKDDFLNIQNKNYFTEALFLASPEFVNNKNKMTDSVDYINTTYKYFSRSFSRCTPFGLFAGCSICKLGNIIDIEIDDMSYYKRRTRLDMSYICMLIQHIENVREIKYKLRYFPNDSLYCIGGKIRYVEYQYQAGRRIHNIISVDNNEYINKVITFSKHGATIEELVACIVDDDTSISEVIIFIEELITSQILKSELDVCTTGEDPLSRLIHKLQELNDCLFIESLVDIKNVITEIDKLPIGSSLDSYAEIIKLIDKIGVKYELRYLFQTDMFKPVKKAYLDIKLIDDLNTLIAFLNITTPKYNNVYLDEFKKTFRERYEDQEVSLDVALDRELGIGYPTSNDSMGDVNTLIDDIVMPYNENTNQRIPYTMIYDILMNKYSESLKLNTTCITLDDKDFPNQVVQWNDLPDTVYVMCTVLKNSLDYKFVIKSIGGPSAANLLTRFCHTDSNIHDLVKSITEKEAEMHKEAIIAEIIHMPESRIGNITLRPHLRNYEIRYLSNSTLPMAGQILVSDILISVKNDTIILKSKANNKHIIPRLTNAHNYALNSMPIYHFLCDIQTQNQRSNLRLGWGGIFDKFEYLPRIEYRNFILSLQQWNINKEVIKGMDKLMNDDLLQKMNWIRNEYRIPREVTISHGDYELYIDLDNPLDIRIMLSETRKDTVLSLKEFILNTHSTPIFDVNGNYFNNEFIIPLYKNN